MRTLIICAAVLLFFGTPDAQVHVGVNINIGRQPVWGPVGYDYVEYYYLPDIDVFYYVPTRRFVYLEGGRWIFRARLPLRYGNIDLFTVHKEVINEERPYLRHDFTGINSSIIRDFAINRSFATVMIQNILW